MKKIFLIWVILLSVSINAQNKDYILVQSDTSIIGFLSSRIGLVFTTQLDWNMMKKITDENQSVTCWFLTGVLLVRDVLVFCLTFHLSCAGFLMFVREEMSCHKVKKTFLFILFHLFGL